VDGAVIVTTPQEVSLADVRKELSFCKKVRAKAHTTAGVGRRRMRLICRACCAAECNAQVGLKVLGVVENMSGAFTHRALACTLIVSLPLTASVRTSRPATASEQAAVH
jgi:hypothetical protein